MAASRRDRALRLVKLVLTGSALTGSVLTGSAAVTGCSLVLDVEGEQCTSDADCVGLFGLDYVCTEQRVCIEPTAGDGDGDGDGGGMAGDGGNVLPPEWQCIEKAPRIIVPKQNQSLTLRLAVSDFVSLTQPEGLVGRACNGMDVNCSSPVIMDITPETDGYLVFEGLPHGWLGYLELEAPDYLPTLVFSNKPYTVDVMPEGPTLLTLEGLESITEGGGEMIIEDRGIVLLAVYDCLGNPGEGVQLVQEERKGEDTETPYYFEGSLPDRDRDETIISRRLTRTMNPLAVGGFNRVREGYQTFYGVLASTGQPIGRVTIQVRPLTMSIAELHAGY